jgi:hypothetical protein
MSKMKEHRRFPKEFKVEAVRQSEQDLCQVRRADYNTIIGSMEMLQYTACPLEPYQTNLQ